MLFLKMLLRYIIIAALILFFSFLEIIVFNEEVLLALCFVIFVFSAYNYLNVTFFDIFSDRAKKIEEDTFENFKRMHAFYAGLIEEVIVWKTMVLGLGIFESCWKRFIKHHISQAKLSHNMLLRSLLSDKVSEISSWERSLNLVVKKWNTQVTIYPIIYYLVKKKWDLKKLLSV